MGKKNSRTEDAIERLKQLPKKKYSDGLKISIKESTKRGRVRSVKRTVFFCLLYIFVYFFTKLLLFNGSWLHLKETVGLT